MRYAPAASDAFNAWVHDKLTALAAALPVDAVVLGGSYGRGEGGVWKEGTEERLYNDLDLWLFARSVVALPSMRDAEARLGVAVDLSRPLTPARARRQAHTLMLHDLWHGHQVLKGPPSIVRDWLPPRLAEPPPPYEALRLHLNRGAGLLWARRIEAGLEDPPDADFIRRNRFKAVLGLGDAWLLVRGQYRPRMSERTSLLPAPLQTWYSAVAAWRTVPSDAPPELPADLLALWADMFREVDAYLAWRGVRERQEHRGLRPLRNLLRYGALKHPRERLYDELLWLLTHAPSQAEWARRSAAFLVDWRRFQ